MLRPYKRGGRSRRRREAGFGEGDGEAAVADVVGGLDGAFGGKGDEAILETFFGGEVDGGRFAGDDAGDHFGVFGGGKFAGGPDEGKSRFLALLGMTRKGSVAIEQEDEVAYFAEGDFEDAGGIVENAEDADDWRRVDGFAESFVVEADVAAGDGRAEGGAGFGEAIDGFAELPHHFGFFGTAEIEAIRCGDGARAAAGYVAGCFGDSMHGADAGIELAPAAIAVGGEREGALHDSGLRILDAHDSGIARAGARQSVCAHAGVVLLGDPAL